MQEMINKPKLKSRLMFVTFALYFLNWISIKFHWYSSIWWLDMFMHFLGGLWVGLVLLWFLPIKIIKKNYFLLIFLGVLFVGVAWEAFEFLVNNRYLAKDPFDIEDTLSDLVFDSIGGLVSLFYFYKRILFKKEVQV